jgi:hypothetical protein
MSSKELKRLGVLGRVEKEALKLVNAAEILGLSYRQMKRIWRRYQEEGGGGSAASQCGSRVRTEEGEEIPGESTAIGTAEILGRGRGAIRADAGGRTFGE